MFVITSLRVAVPVPVAVRCRVPLTMIGVPASNSVEKTPRQEIPFNPFLLPRGLAPLRLQPRYGFVAEGAIQQTL